MNIYLRNDEFITAIDVGPDWTFGELRRAAEGICDMEDNKGKGTILKHRNEQLEYDSEVEIDELGLQSDDVVDVEASGMAIAKKMLKRQETPVNAESLLRSTEEGDLETIKLLLSAGLSCNSKDSAGRTSLTVACSIGSVEIVEYLLSLPDIDVDTSSYSGCSALMWSTVGGNRDITEMLIIAGCQLNNQSNSGETALMWAAFNKQFEIVQILAPLCDVNETCKSGKSALMFAAIAGSKPIVQLLVENGVDLHSSGVGMAAARASVAHGNCQIAAYINSIMETQTFIASTF